VKEEIIKAAVNLLLPPEASIPAGEITAGSNLAQSRSIILRELKRISYKPKADEQDTLKDLSCVERIDCVIETASQVAHAAERFVAENHPAFVKELPGWELLRVYKRKVPEKSWPNRWRAACEASGDAGALQVFEKTGRMIALKSSGVWQALGDGAGDYDDTLGNPFPPFALGSGFDVDQVPCEDCEELGLLQPKEKASSAVVLSANEFSKRLVAQLHQHLAKMEHDRRTT
jgi:hypothetical protein